MPWYFPWSESIKKRACRYLLQHYLGDFLKEKLTLEQLTVDLYNGKGTVSDVPLDVWALNEMLENVGIPLEIIDGFINSISVAVPWTSLLSESCHIDLNGLELTFGPKHKSDPFHHGSMFDSTMSWNSMNMTTSMQLAEQCLKQDPTIGEEQAESAQMFEGLEAFAQTIESVLSRIKLSFINTIIRLEDIPLDNAHGVGLELHIDRIDYLDLSHDDFGNDSSSNHGVYEPVAIAIKNFQIFGVKLYMDEFPFEKRTRLRETEEKSGPDDGDHYSHSANENGNMPEQKDTPCLMPQVQILGSHGKQSIKVKVKHNDTLPGPKIDLEYSLGALNILLSPRQLHLLINIAERISSSSSDVKESQKKNMMRPMNSDDYKRVEQVLQQQITTSSSKRRLDKKPDSWQNTFESLNSTNSLNSIECQEEEFYSMSDYSSLPPLGEPPKLTAVVGDNSGFSGCSPEKSLTSVSLGGSSSLLSTMNSPPKAGSLTEQATNVFKASSPPNIPQAPRTSHILKSPRASSSSGLVGISSLDDTSDLNNFKLRSSNIIIILIHQDPIDAPKRLAKHAGSEHFLAEISDNFFEGIAPFSIQNLFGESGEDARKQLSSFFPYDHLRILMSGLTTSCESRTISNSRSLGVDFVIGKLMIDENLYDKTRKSTPSHLPCSQTKLLHFPTDQTMSVYPTGFGAAPSPCVKVRMQKAERGKTPLTAVQSRTSIIPKSLINIQLSKVEIEVDISIVDRIAGILYPPLMQQRTGNRSSNLMYSSFLSGPILNRQTAFNQAMEDSPVHADSKTDITVTCPELNILIRFPIPDLRPASDIDKAQWWQKSIRNEFLTLDLRNLEFKTMLSHSQTSNLYELRFREGEGFFHYSEEEKLQFLHVSCSKIEDDVEEMHLDWPRIVICKQPLTTRSVFEDADDAKQSPDSQFDSLEESFSWMKAEPSPFSSNPVMFEKEKLVMPGSIPEMNNFQEIASATSKFFISFSFPDLQLCLHDKSNFELIYNRLFNDLLMWESSAPSPVETTPLAYPQIQNNLHINLASQVGFSTNQKFFMCRSAIKDAYDSDSDQDISLASTTVDGIDSQNQILSQNQQSNISVLVHIDRGKVAFFPKTAAPCDDEQTAENDDTELGHVIIDVEDFNFFTVVSYRGDANLDYSHLYSGDATLYHSGLVDCEIDRFNMEDAFCCHNMNRTIYRSEDSVLSSSREAQDVANESVSAFSLAMKATHLPSKNRKDVLVALGLRGSTLRHVVTDLDQTWLTQIMEFMAVEDQTVLGYTFPSVITTLYLQLWGCSLDYRPKHLSLRSLLTVETFSLSSNISPGSSESVLRFIVDDSALYLSDKQFEYIDLNKDYVCVMDMGLFELVLRLSEAEAKKRPKLDLSMSNNVLNIHTCSDSCAALVNLIKYIASDGDINFGNQDILTEPNSQNESTENLYSRSSLDENTIDSLMADALIENDSSKETDAADARMVTDRHGFTSSELFSSSATSNSSSTRSLQERLEDACDDDYDDENSSGDEYCILEQDDENDEDVDFEPLARKLVNSEIQILDNYFQVPRGKYDLLSAPADYPCPVYRYTLREMSVVWQMYGGRDFQIPEHKSSSPLMECGSPTLTCYSPKRSPKHSSVQGKKTQRFVKKNEDKNLTRADKERRKGKYKGGLGRDYNTLMELHLNKIRFQHEIYPDDADKISRNVLLVYDVELTDRLVSSQINKFLYRFSSESLPIKSSAHMITVKLLLTKPEDGVKNKEGTLRISLQPIRLNIDQDALFFLKNYFTEISDDNLGRNVTPIPEVRTTKKEGIRFSSSPSCGGALENAVEELNLNEEHFTMAAPPQGIQVRDNTPQEDSPVFFRSVVFSSDVPIRLDYHGKSVNIGQGTLAGLLIGLAQLNCSELKLKRLCNRSGLLGNEKILSYFLNEWLMDIRRNQIPGILGGVGPTYSFVQLYQGIKDLFWLPVQQYRQDGRLVRGLQKGAHSFSTSTAMAILEITNRIVQTVQVAAETAYDMVTPGQAAEGGAVKRHLATSKADQPVDLREGVANAYNVLSEGISHTATTIVRVAVEEHEKKGVTGAVGGVLRQIPPSIMQPFILATEATSNVLGGARNQLSPDARIEASKKWKSTQKSQ